VDTAGRIVLGGLAFALLFGGVTLWALESDEVVVLRTRGGSGGARETRTWIADDADGSWIEVASPGRPFLADVRANPEIEVWRQHRWRRCRATVEASPAGHDRIRRLLRATYGWKDRWIGMLADTTQSLALRVACEAP
jgi:hypothetical protein